MRPICTGSGRCQISIWRRRQEWTIRKRRVGGTIVEIRAPVLEILPTPDLDKNIMPPGSMDAENVCPLRGRYDGCSRVSKYLALLWLFLMTNPVNLPGLYFRQIRIMVLLTEINEKYLKRGKRNICFMSQAAKNGRYLNTTCTGIRAW